MLRDEGHTQKYTALHIYTKHTLTHLHPQTRTHTHAHTHARVHTHKHTRTHTHTHTNSHTQTYVALKLRQVDPQSTLTVLTFR